MTCGLKSILKQDILVTFQRGKISGINYSIELIYIFYKQVVKGLLEAPEIFISLALNYVSFYFTEHLL